MIFSQITVRSQFCFKLFLASMALGGGLCWEMVYSVAPAIAQTTLNENLTLASRQEESYASFIRRAEAYAGNRVQGLFDKDLLRTEVRLTVLGQHGLAIAPILTLRVSRREWTAYPDPEIWSIYYPESSYLLNFYDDFVPQKTVAPPVVTPPVVETPTTLFEAPPAMMDTGILAVPTTGTPATDTPATGNPTTTATPTTNPPAMDTTINQSNP